MRSPVRSRLIAVAVAAGSLMALPFALPASAAVATTCSKGVAVSNTVKSTAVEALSGCTNLPATGGSGTLTANFKNLKAITITVKWNKTGTIGPFVVAETLPKTGNKCKFETVKNKKVQDLLAGATGTIKGGTGAAAKLLKGQKFSELLCVTQKATTYLEPGTKVTF